MLRGTSNLNDQVSAAPRVAKFLAMLKSGVEQSNLPSVLRLVVRI